MGLAYHLGLGHPDLAGAELALLPGDPGRVPALAMAVGEARRIGSHRGFEAWISWKQLDEENRLPVAVVATGIGGPSLTTVAEELIGLGCKLLVRVGTAGAIAPDLEPGAVVVVTGAARLEGASRHYLPPEWPAIPDLEVTEVLLEAARVSGLPWKAGVVVTSDTFYPGQERLGPGSGPPAPWLAGTLSLWRELGAIAYEMECAALFALGTRARVRTGAVLGIVVSREKGEEVTPKGLEAGERGAVGVAARALPGLLELLTSASP